MLNVCGLILHSFDVCILSCGSGNKRSFGDLEDDEDDIFGPKKVVFFVWYKNYVRLCTFYLLMMRPDGSNEWVV